MNDEKVWNISEVNSAVREIIEGSLMPFWLQGEVGTLNIHRSGHVYLTLKDNKSQLRGVFFNGANSARQLGLRVGMQVEAFGKLTVYEVRGDYQFSVRQLRLAGLGDLQRRFEELKKKLFEEGLFDDTYKKPIPTLPQRIGVITSPDGAAIRDFLQIINRRFPNVNILIYPAPVQGQGAERKLAKGVDFFNRSCQVDVIVITRGGGSMEDLWPFNEEVLAREIADSDIPVISAVGHEIDYTICDFVADMRVPTPSAAAELVIGRREEFENYVSQTRQRMLRCLQLTHERLSRRYESAANSYVFREPIHLLRQQQQQLDDLTRALSDAAVRACERSTSRLQQATGRLRALNPLAVLGRGYSVLSDKATGQVVMSPNQLHPGSEVEALVAEGRLSLRFEHGEKQELTSPNLEFEGQCE